jgi:glutathione-regulated potassium-efflux system ancillary protein KefC
MEHNMLLNALVYLAAAVIAVPIAKRLGLGAVLGYLLAGIAIGPWGLGLIREVEDILHFAEFGVVLLLFVIGLELEPRRLWALRRSIFGWGTVQVLGVTAALLLAAVAAGIGWKTALIAALGLSLSSTAIALTTMQERNLIPTPAGQAGFSILLFQDIAAIPMIALLPLLGVPDSHPDGGWSGALKAAAVIGGLVLAGRFLVRPLLRFIARTGLREIFTAFALLLVIAISLLMAWSGMSMALGAFMAGVLLADSEYRHALEADLEPFKGLLLGLFFIAVGMSVDFGVLLAQPWRIVLMATAFLSIKLAMLWLMARFFGMAGRQRVLFAFLLSQGGEFAFVVFGAAATARVFAPETASVLVLVVALSMLATPLLLILYDRVLEPRWQRLRRREPDAIDANRGHVIIAGFGRFGQIVGRLLHANQVPLTMLDHDPDQIDTLRQFGFKVFYGDATRIDLLHAAGAHHARALVLSVDGVEDSLKLAAAVRAEFPDLPILARARNVTHYYELMDLGVTVIERETFESALMLGRRVMEELGYGAYFARQAAMRFREHNLKSVLDVYPYYKDREQYASMARRAREELHAMFERDFVAIRADREAEGDEDRTMEHREQGGHGGDRHGE